MTLETGSTSAEDDRRQQLQQLEHDLKTYLGIVSLGLQALESVREQPEDFARWCRTIHDEGIKPLKHIVAEIVARVADEPV